ncbi:MAG: LpxL/LpxP family Kdo(2)-lipid IV(A) lauroyl/palmitoleoyl acyltransferase [Pseudomonadota bacterium]
MQYTYNWNVYPVFTLQPVRAAGYTSAVSDTTPTPNVPLTRFLGPRYWPVWLGLGFMRLSSWLPYRGLMLIGRLLGRLAYYAIPKRRRIAERNIAKCFADLSEQEQARLVKEHLQSIGTALMEISLAWWGSEKRLRELTELVGLEHLQAAQARGCGVVLLAGHFTTIEIGGVLLTRHAEFDAMYRKFENPLFEEVMRRKRERWARRVIKRGDFRQMLRSLKEGRTVLYMPDQAYVRKGHVLAPFFGHPAPTNTGTERLTRNTGAQVVPFLPVRKADGSGYRIMLFPALDDFPGDNSLANATRINQVFEAHVLEAPEQYLWMHRRFKDQPGFYD